MLLALRFLNKDLTELPDACRPHGVAAGSMDTDYRQHTAFALQSQAQEVRLSLSSASDSTDCHESVRLDNGLIGQAQQSPGLIAGGQGATAWACWLNAATRQGGCCSRTDDVRTVTPANGAAGNTPSRNARLSPHADAHGLCAWGGRSTTGCPKPPGQPPLEVPVTRTPASLCSCCKSFCSSFCSSCPQVAVIELQSWGGIFAKH